MADEAPANPDLPPAPDPPAEKPPAKEPPAKAQPPKPKPDATSPPAGASGDLPAGAIRHMVEVGASLVLSPSEPRVPGTLGLEEMMAAAGAIPDGSTWHPTGLLTALRQAALEAFSADTNVALVGGDLWPRPLRHSHLVNRIPAAPVNVEAGNYIFDPSQAAGSLRHPYLYYDAAVPMPPKPEVLWVDWMAKASQREVDRNWRTATQSAAAAFPQPPPQDAMWAFAFDELEVIKSAERAGWLHAPFRKLWGYYHMALAAEAYGMPHPNPAAPAAWANLLQRSWRNSPAFPQQSGMSGVGHYWPSIKHGHRGFFMEHSRLDDETLVVLGLSAVAYPFFSPTAGAANGAARRIVWAGYRLPAERDGLVVFHDLPPPVAQAGGAPAAWPPFPGPPAALPSSAKIWSTMVMLAEANGAWREMAEAYYFTIHVATIHPDPIPAAPPNGPPGAPLALLAAAQAAGPLVAGQAQIAGGIPDWLGPVPFWTQRGGMAPSYWGRSLTRYALSAAGARAQASDREELEGLVGLTAQQFFFMHNTLGRVAAWSWGAAAATFNLCGRMFTALSTNAMPPAVQPNPGEAAAMLQMQLESGSGMVAGWDILVYQHSKAAFGFALPPSGLRGVRRDWRWGGEHFSRLAHHYYNFVPRAVESPQVADLMINILKVSPVMSAQWGVSAAGKWTYTPPGALDPTHIDIVLPLEAAAKRAGGEGRLCLGDMEVVSPTMVLGGLLGAGLAASAINLQFRTVQGNNDVAVWALWPHLQPSALFPGWWYEGSLRTWTYQAGQRWEFRLYAVPGADPEWSRLVGNWASDNSAPYKPDCRSYWLTGSNVSIPRFNIPSQQAPLPPSLAALLSNASLTARGSGNV